MNKIYILCFVFLALNNVFSQENYSLETVNAKISENNFAEAEKILTYHIERGNTSKVLFIYRGFSYFNLKEFSKAIGDYNKAIEIGPDAVSYFWRGRSKLVLKQNIDAIADFDRAIELNFEQKDDCYYYKGLAKLLIDDKSGCADIDKAIELGYTSANQKFLDFCKE
jgi:tetratricopeptide (TPR) repeat protein